jgi:ABC-type Na+ transport system ATPase subunit NatA
MTTAQEQVPGGMLAPLVREIGRIAAVAEDREAAHLAEIARLEDEVRRLRETVAHLRTSTAPVPVHLRVVVARAMCETADTAVVDAPTAGVATG